MGVILAFLSIIAVLSVVILVHEVGHLLAAKSCGIKVISFCFGIGPKIFTRRIGDTFYSIATIPLGGYVRPLFKYKEGEEPQLEAPKL